MESTNSINNFQVTFDECVLSESTPLKRGKEKMYVPYFSIYYTQPFLLLKYSFKIMCVLYNEVTDFFAFPLLFSKLYNLYYSSVPNFWNAKKYVHDIQGVVHNFFSGFPLPQIIWFKSMAKVKYI